MVKVSVMVLMPSVMVMVWFPFVLIGALQSQKSNSQPSHVNVVGQTAIVKHRISRTTIGEIEVVNRQTGQGEILAARANTPGKEFCAGDQVAVTSVVGNTAYIDGIEG